MSSLIAQEGWFWLHSVMLGIGITFVYDGLRIWRRVFEHSMFWISAEDLLYWAFVACSFFYLLYMENNGAFRWFSVFGAAVGMLLYQKSVSPLWVEYMSRFLRRVRAVAGAVRRFLGKPFRAAKRAGEKHAKRQAKRAKRLVRICKKRLTVWLKLSKMFFNKRKTQRGREHG